MRRDRAVSSVADISLALVIIAACILMVAGMSGSDAEEHDPKTATQTVETLGATTATIDHSLAPVLETNAEYVQDPTEYREQFDRSTHATLLSHVARAAVARSAFRIANDTVRPLDVGINYLTTIEDAVLVQLADAGITANITATWQPYTNSSLRGTVSVGPTPPIDHETTLIRTTVSSELPSSRDEAVDSVVDANGSAGFEPVARAVASAIVDGTFADAQREIETGGVPKALTLSRYLRFGDVVGNIDRTYSNVTPGLDRSVIDTEAMNEALIDGLSDRFTPELQDSFADPATAARAVSTGTVTISITTWERE